MSRLDHLTDDKIERAEKLLLAARAENCRASEAYKEAAEAESVAARCTLRAFNLLRGNPEDYHEGEKDNDTV